MSIPKGRLCGPFSFARPPVKRRPRLTRARLRELLHYDPESGEFRWRKRPRNSVHIGDVAGCITPAAYRRIRIRGRAYFAHQLAWFYMTGHWGQPSIDHRDGDPTNNRWGNLRRATPSQNCANRRRQQNNKSGFKGVFPYRGRWRASISKNGRLTVLGTFAAPQAAHAAYEAAARELFGEFARTE
jgi:HNH endonuclease